MKKRGLASIILGGLSLFYLPFLRSFDDRILEMLDIIATKYHLYYLYDHALVITASIFILFALVGIILGIQGRKSEGKVVSTIGIILSSLGLLIVISFVSFVYLVGYFWGG